METIKMYCDSAEIEILELKDDTLVLVDKIDNAILKRGSEIEIATYITEVISEFEEKNESEKIILEKLINEYFNN